MTMRVTGVFSAVTALLLAAVAIAESVVSEGLVVEDITNPEPVLRPMPMLEWRLGGGVRRFGDRLVVDVSGTGGTSVAEADFDLTPYLGRGLRLEIKASGKNVTEPKNAWNGVKVQLKYREKDSRRTVHCDASLRLRGTFTNETFAIVRRLDAVAVESCQLRLGLQESSGHVEFDLSTLRIGIDEGMFRIVHQDWRVKYPASVAAWRGRGVMSPQRPMTEDDFKTLASWGANLLRFQIVRNWTRENDNRDLDEYDQWLEGKLDHLERFVLPMAVKHGLKVVVDLHVFPGGRDEGHETNMLHDWRYAEHFIRVWRRMATRFRGRSEIYGYDLANELNQCRRSDVTDYWNLQYAAAKEIRKIDPHTPIVVGANLMENPKAFETLSPIPMDNVIYQVHMYEPGQYTHYRVFEKNRRGVPPDPAMCYPSSRPTGEKWDKDYLRRVLGPVRAFQQRHQAKVYVGEFSSGAWNLGAAEYLADCIDLFEEYGWDWTYHAFREWTGWSVEHEGPDVDALVPSADNPRKRVLIRGLRVLGR